MAAKSRARWGDGRIEVSAKWAEIAGALSQEWPLTRIYEKFIDQTKIGYSQFRRQVQNHMKSEHSVTIPAPPADVIRPLRQILGTAHVRHDQARRTFDFDPADKGADRDKLIGPGGNRNG